MWERSIISTAIEHWLETGTISAEQAQKLRSSYADTGPIEWKVVSGWCFLIAIACTFLSVAILLFDEWFTALLYALFNLPALAKSIGLAILAGGFFWGGVRTRTRSPDKTERIKAKFFGGVVATAFSIHYLGKSLLVELDYSHADLVVSAQLMLAAISYGILGLWLRTNVIWLFALLSLAAWFGYETGRTSSVWGYWLGMNYPLRYALFWAVITLDGLYLFSRWKDRGEFLRPTMITGLLFFFLALYAASFCGNYAVYECDKLTLVQASFWWAILALASIAAIAYGLRHKDDLIQEFGWSFIFLNLYSRYFEYFWDTMHKALFFAILGASFWLIGINAEKIWRLRAASDWLERSADKQHPEATAGD